MGGRELTEPCLSVFHGFDRFFLNNFMQYHVGFGFVVFFFFLFPFGN